MKIRNYTDETVNEVYQQLKNNTDGGRCVDKLFEIYNELAIPAVKKAIIHDLSAFLNAWFKLVNDTKDINPVSANTLLNKVLSPTFIQSDRYIHNLENICKKCSNGDRRIKVLTGYVRSCIKAVIMTKRRSLGFDTQGSKFYKNN